MEVQEFNMLFAQLTDKLFRMAKSILRDTDEAKDTLQDLQLKLWEKRDVLKNADNKNAFTLRTMRNLCIDNLRKRRYSEELTPDLEYHSPSPMQQLETNDMAKHIITLINKLPEIQRSVIRMRDVEEMEIPEIAYVMDLTENAVCTNLSRARAKIRTQILNELQTCN